MANTKSAKKQIRQDTKREARNRWRKRQIKGAIREFDDALHAGETDKAAKQLEVVFKTLDRVAARNTIHKNAAARKKSRLSKRLDAARAK